MNDLGSHELKSLDGMNKSRVWMIWTILGRETMALKCYEQHKPIVDMNEFGSWAQGSRCYEKLKAMANMNISRSWAQGIRCSQQLKAIDDMTNSRLQAQSFRYYE